MKKENKNWAKSLLAIAKKAKGSKIGDLSRKHNDILDLAGKYRAPKGKSALKARSEMEKNYKRF